MNIRRNKLDVRFSLFIRTRDKWTCQRCGKYHPEGSRQSLHASHFHSRRKQSVRYDFSNCAAHCFSCHQYLGENPIEFAKWIVAFLGEKEAALLQGRANQTLKRSKKDKEELYQDLKAELEGLAA